MTPNDVAEWMVEQLSQLHYLDQGHVTYYLQLHAPELTYYNQDGGLGIDKRVLDAFRKRTPDVVWSRSSLHWRARQPYDVPGKRMQD